VESPSSRQATTAIVPPRPRSPEQRPRRRLRAGDTRGRRPCEPPSRPRHNRSTTRSGRHFRFGRRARARARRGTSRAPSSPSRSVRATAGTRPTVRAPARARGRRAGRTRRTSQVDLDSLPIGAPPVVADGLVGSCRAGEQESREAARRPRVCGNCQRCTPGRSPASLRLEAGSSGIEAPQLPRFPFDARRKAHAARPAAGSNTAS